MASDAKGVLQDVVALDCESNAIYAVRLRRSHDRLVLAGAAQLPGIGGREASVASRRGRGGGRLLLPKSMKAKASALTVSGERGVVRLVHFRDAIDRASVWEKRIRENLGVDSSFRIGYVTGSSAGKGRDTALAVALPREDIDAIIGRLGVERQLVSLEISGLAAMNSYLHGPGRSLNEPAAVVVAGEQVTLLGIVHKDKIILVRKFALGRDAVIRRLAEEMSIETDVADQMFAEATFDISTLLDEVLGPFITQLNISREFVERHEDCHLNRLYLTGSMSQSPYWVRCLKEKTGMEPVLWDPFEGLEKVEDVLNDNLRSLAPRFSAAVGAALGALGAI